MTFFLTLYNLTAPPTYLSTFHPTLSRTLPAAHHLFYCLPIALLSGCERNNRRRHLESGQKQVNRGDLYTMTAWQPATQPWRRPPPDVINKLQKGTPTRRDITDLLHCSFNDYDSMIGEIERLLNLHGINENSTIATTSEKQKALQIIAQLKTNSQFIPFLTWAVGQGEDQNNVDLAILGAIHTVHNNRKRREKRRQQKEKTVQSPAIDSPPSSQENVTSKANTEAKPLLLQPSQDDEESYKVHVRIRDQQYGILLARTLSAEEKYQMLRADCEKRLADTGSLEEVTGFIELDGSGDETVFDTSKYLEYLLKAAEKRDQKVKLIAKFGETKRRKFGQITTDMVEADQICLI